MTMSDYELRRNRSEDAAEISDLIRESTNQWYVAHGNSPIFTGDPSSTRLFYDVYEELDPGCCLLAVEKKTGLIAASCFYHPRSTHVSLGIMNVHPDHFGKGLARMLLNAVVSMSEDQKKPTRLVSSAMNLDSYSLYTRGGFVPRYAYQDMFLEVPQSGMPSQNLSGLNRVRLATLRDLEAIVQLEEEVQCIERRKDHHFFLENRQGIWNVCVIDHASGSGIDGVLVSVKHPGSTMLGPGVMRSTADAAALIWYQLNQFHRGGRPVWLVPVECDDLVAELYTWGARNCEIHFAQVRGMWKEPSGVVMPTFMPETG